MRAEITGVLVRLAVQNYVLLDQVEVCFKPGLNVLTGETGAGKSLLVGAIGFILGKRADGSVVLDESRKCVVEAEFQLIHPAEVDALLHDEGLDPSEGVLVLRREISPGGRSRAFVNDSPASATLLRELTRRVIDLHGQHEGQRLLDESEQMRVLDHYASLQTVRAAYSSAYQAWQHTRSTLAQVEQRQQQDHERLSYLRYQLQELHAARLQPHEDQRLEEELARAEHAAELVEGMTQHAAALYSGEQAVVSQLAASVRDLERLATHDARLRPEVERLRDAMYAVQEVGRNLEAMPQDIELDPARMQATEERLSVYNRLKMKFGVRDGAELMARQHTLEQELAQADTSPERLEALRQQVSQQQQQVLTLALALEQGRLQAAAHLSERMAQELAQVALPQAQMQVQVARLAGAFTTAEPQPTTVDLTPTGMNRVQFMLSTHPSLAPAPLAQVASGGEISRLQLALKAALAERLALSALIFDEIDTGISGEVALKVGRVIERLASHHQVLVITHLPQIASRQGAHFTIEKQEQDGRIISTVRELSPHDRPAEVATMLSGANPSETALAGARELLSL